MSAPGWLGEAERLTEGATPGEWSRDAWEHKDGEVTENVHARAWDVAVCRVSAGDMHPDVGDRDTQAFKNAEFIAASRTLLPRAVEALRAVLELHPYTTWNGKRWQRFKWVLARQDPAFYDEFCQRCRTPWPCLTVAAIEGQR